MDFKKIDKERKEKIERKKRDEQQKEMERKLRRQQEEHEKLKRQVEQKQREDERRREFEERMSEIEQAYIEEQAYIDEQENENTMSDEECKEYIAIQKIRSAHAWIQEGDKDERKLKREFLKHIKTDEQKKFEKHLVHLRTAEHKAIYDVLRNWYENNYDYTVDPFKIGFDDYSSRETQFEFFKAWQEHKEESLGAWGILIVLIILCALVCWIPYLNIIVFFLSLIVVIKSFIDEKNQKDFAALSPEEQAKEIRTKQIQEIEDAYNKEWDRLTNKNIDNVKKGHTAKYKDIPDDINRYKNPDAYNIYIDQISLDASNLKLEATKSKSQHACDVLGVPIDASKKEIQKAYHDLAKQYHPDNIEHMAPGLKSIANEKMAEINAAYKELMAA